MTPDVAPPRPGRALWKRFALAALAIVVLTGGATATAGLLEVATFVDDLNHGTRISTPRDLLENVDPGKPQTILVIGSDKRFRNGGSHDARSDTMILVHLDADRPTTVMSIPRDLKVRIPRAHGVVQTDKINAAYSIGGPVLTARVIKSLLSTPGQPFRLSHIVNVNFGGFRRAVDYVKCVYTDVDRRYFNDNAGVAPSQGYATIDIRAGYQKLCGSDALDYVRFRHLDNDIVRAARQQDFLRQAKQQYGVQSIVDNRHQLARIFGRYTQSDSQLHSTDALLKLMTLVAFSAQNSIREVHFPAVLPNDPKDPYVRATPAGIRRAVSQFMSDRASAGPRAPTRAAPAKRRGKRGARKRLAAPASGLVDATSAGQSQVAVAVGRPRGLPVYYPKLLTANGSYASPRAGDNSRTYRIHDDHGGVHAAYRLVVYSGFIGNYYGVQGMTWKSPPILSKPSEYRNVGGKRLALYFDGSRLRLIAWRTRRAVYWVSNTLQEILSNQQLLGIAASLTRAGGGR